jgi:hypothetical protein
MSREANERWSRASFVTGHPFLVDGGFVAM